MSLPFEPLFEKRKVPDERPEPYESDTSQNQNGSRMILVLLFFTLASFLSFSCCVITPGIPVLGVALFLCLTLLLAAAAAMHLKTYVLLVRHVT